MKKRIAIAALIASMLVLTACGGPNIEGTWKLTEIKLQSSSDVEMKYIELMVRNKVLEVEFVFEKGGKMTAKYDSDYVQIDMGSGEGTYKVSGNKLTMKVADEMTTEFKVDGDTMEMEMSTATWVFTRQK